MSIKVKLRLPVPEGRPGDTVVLSEERAQILVDRRYAEFVEKSTAAPQDAISPAVFAPDEQPSDDSGAAPVTDLPNKSDLKEEWEKAASALGISLEDADGNVKNKDVLIAEVEAAVTD